MVPPSWRRSAARAYPHPVDRVDVVETHISWVFLAGDRVYKVKKPVDLGFLDFTTLERRRFFCEEEVRLNRRLTHDVYRERPPTPGQSCCHAIARSTTHRCARLMCGGSIPSPTVMPRLTTR